MDSSLNDCLETTTSSYIPDDEKLVEKNIVECLTLVLFTSKYNVLCFKYINTILFFSFPCKFRILYIF